MQSDQRSSRSNPFSTPGVVAGLTRALLLSAAVVAPWFFGAVKAPFQAILCGALCLVLLGCALGQCFRKAPPLPTMVIPLALAIGLGVFQLVPFSSETLQWLSPRGATLWRELDEWTLNSTDAPASDDAAQTRTISLYPASTGHDLALLVLCVGGFVAASQLFSAPKAGLWLCGAVAINGAALSFFGLVQQLTWNGRIYWQVPLTRGGSPFASFVNRNNAGGYLNLCLAGAMGLMIWVFSRKSHRRVARRGSRWIVWLADLDAAKVSCVAITVLTAAGVILTLSRGAWCAAAAGVMVTILVGGVARAARPPLAWLLPILGGVALVVWLGRGEIVQSRLNTMLDRSNTSTGRLVHWPAGVRAARDFAGLGSGLGTYRYVYRSYQTDVQDVWFFHAENQYLEALVEAGVLGLSCLVICISMTAYACWRLLRSSVDPADWAVGIAGCYALLTQSIHAFFDFGLYLPANALLMALFCGTVAGGAARTSVRPSGLRAWFRHSWLALPRVSAISAFAVIALAAGAGYGHLECERLGSIESLLDTTRFLTHPKDGDADRVFAATAQLNAACQRRPQDAEGLLRLAELQVHAFRIAALHQLDEYFSQASGAPRAESRWALTAPSQLHAKAQILARSGQLEQLERWRREPLIADHLPSAIHHLFLARNACPLLPRVHLQLGELTTAVTAPHVSGVNPHLRRAEMLYPTDAGLLMHLGLLDLHAGRTSEAISRWRRSAELKPSRIAALVTLAREGNLLEHLVDMLPQSPEVLVRVAHEEVRPTEEAETRASLLAAAEKLLQQQPIGEDSTGKGHTNYLMGSIRSLQGRRSDAIGYLEHAVQLRPTEVAWRFELAQLLKAEGEVDRAYEHAHECQRAEPANSKFEELFRELIRLRLVGNDPSPNAS